jgi:hypothetical protein
MSDSTILYERLITENKVEGKEYEVWLTVSEFRGVTYLGIRKYFLSFDDGFVPSKEGISIPFEINSSYALLEGLIDICSEAESVEALKDKLESSKST